MLRTEGADEQVSRPSRIPAGMILGANEHIVTAISFEAPARGHRITTQIKRFLPNEAVAR